MNKIALLGLVFLVGCSNRIEHSKPIVISEIETTTYKNYCYFNFRSENMVDNELSFYFLDSCNAFKIGDSIELKFVKKE
jgi:hypothetical protein